jgi:TRAP-type C4-dicarboxylate transport system permease small subunit
MPHLLEKITRRFSQLAAGGASLSMTLLFLIVFVNSVRRYAIGKSFEWGEELPIYLGIYGVMFGMAWAYIQDRHIRFTMLVGFLSESMTRRLYFLVDIIMVVNGLLLTYSGWMFVIKRGRLESPGIINMAKWLKALTGWDGMIWIGHMYPYQAAIVIGGALLTIAALLKLLQRISEKPATESTGE